MKLRLDNNSIKFKTWMYFVLFTVCLMIVLWGLQVFFLNNFYEIMKTQQTRRTIEKIDEEYENCSISKFMKYLSTIADSNDLYIYLIGSDKKILSFQPSEEVAGAGFYFQQIDNVEKYRNTHGKKRMQLKIEGVDNTKEVLAYVDTLESKHRVTYDIYLFSPLWPVTSTIKILTSQLLYVSFIALLIACLLSIYLSTRITRPIREITKSADKLASGEYGIVFKGGHYTEINNLADTLTRASIELEKTDVIQKDLVANVSHDLRTPLTMIKSYAEMIRDLSGDIPEKREAHLQVIIDEADRLNTLVDDLLSVSRMQSGKLTLDIGEFNLSEATRQIVNTYAIRNEDGYNLNFTCPNEFYVTGDVEKMKQVISNLITNALKFCGDDKVVNVRLERIGRNGVILTVEDHGIGIAPDELAHVWDRYYKASSNMVRTTEGSGLGLAISKEILVLHKCEYGVDSELGQGTRFWFRMNLTKVDETAVNPAFKLSDTSATDTEETETNNN